MIAPKYYIKNNTAINIDLILSSSVMFQIYLIFSETKIFLGIDQIYIMFFLLFLNISNLIIYYFHLNEEKRQAIIIEIFKIKYVNKFPALYSEEEVLNKDFNVKQLLDKDLLNREDVILSGLIFSIITTIIYMIDTMFSFSILPIIGYLLMIISSIGAISMLIECNRGNCINGIIFFLPVFSFFVGFNLI
jgi:hypothetical protein